MRGNYPNLVMFGGLIEGAEPLPPTGNSGRRVRAYIRNPTEGRGDDVLLEVIGFGKKGARILELDGALVVVEGRHGPADGPSQYVVVERISVMDEEDPG